MKRLEKLPDWMPSITRPVNRACFNPKCMAIGITAYQDRDGYGMAGGEIIPQDCPGCGESLNQVYWGNVRTRWVEVDVQ